MKICIGIISYLPDNSSSRRVRMDRLNSLLKQLNDHFKLPILIVAQNWKDFKVVFDNISIFQYDKLGITKARATLREHFLQSTYDYMIMLDDDMELSDNQADYDNYLDTVIKNRKEYYYVKNFQNNFSCISKGGFKKVEYDLAIDPERGTGFEDYIFSEKCKACLDSMRIITSLPKYERNHFLHDPYSTWEDPTGSLSAMNENVSKKIVEKIRKHKPSGVNWF